MSENKAEAVVVEQDPAGQNLTQDPGATLTEQPSDNPANPDDETDSPARTDEPNTDANNDPRDTQPVDVSPNVIFIGKRRRNGKEEPLTEAPKKLISGPHTFKKLPSSEEQLEGFYYEKAAELCRAFPGLYKQIIKKGE